MWGLFEARLVMAALREAGQATREGEGGVNLHGEADVPGGIGADVNRFL